MKLERLRGILLVGGRLLQQAKIKRSFVSVYGFIYRFILKKICFKITIQDTGDCLTSGEKSLVITLYKLTCNDHNYIVGEIIGHSE